MHSRSDRSPSQFPGRRAAVVLLGLVALLVMVPALRAAADVINTGRYILQPDAVQREDVLIASSSATVDGTIEGDLVIATNSMSIAGTVTGDVTFAVRGDVVVTGTIEGSLRGVARSVEVRGSVGDDVAVGAWSFTMEGEAGRDVFGYVVSGDVGGVTGRDVLGRYLGLEVVGEVGRDVDVTAERLTVSDSAVIDGDLVYQARSVDVSDQAAVAGQVIEVPAGTSFFIGLVLELAFLVGFLGYLVGGIVLLWLFRSTSARAVAAVAERPWRTFGIGAIATVLVGPILLALLTASFVGIPLAVVLLLVMLVGLIFGTVPAVAAVGWKTLGGRGGAYGGFLAAAVVWRLMVELVPVVGAVLFVAALLWGMGGWTGGAWRARAAALRRTASEPSGTFSS